MTDKQKQILRALAGGKIAELRGSTLALKNEDLVTGVAGIDIGTLVDQQMLTAIGVGIEWALTNKGERYAELLGNV